MSANGRRVESLPLALLRDTLAVCRLEPDDAVPAWALTSRPIGVVARTPDELSLVVSERALPPDAGDRLPMMRIDRGWRAFMVRGPLPFDLVGVLASIAEPLADAGLSIFAMSTFDTDYVLVKSADVERARETLAAAGHVVG